jgi:hypothetical protein
MSNIFEIKGYKVKVCEEYPAYAVSKCGRIFRIDSEKEMTHTLQGVPKYWYIRTCINGKAACARVHRLLAKAWIPNPNPEIWTTVNHIDGNKLNNHLDNLEWCSLAQNQQHAGQNLESSRGEGLYNSSFDENTAHELCKKLSEGYRVRDLSDSYNISMDVLRKLKAGDTWFHVRKLYQVPHQYRTEFSTKTICWVCEKINEGISDQNIAKISTNKNLKVIEVKRIRHKIRYKDISDLYF